MFEAPHIENHKRGRAPADGRLKGSEAVLTLAVRLDGSETAETGPVLMKLSLHNAQSL